MKINSLDDVDLCLSSWGRWVAKTEMQGLGYPETSPMFRAALRDGGYRSGYLDATAVAAAQWTEDVKLCQRAISRLEQEARENDCAHLLVSVARKMYVQRAPVSRIAEEMGVHRDTVYRWRDRLLGRVAVEFGVFVA